MKKSNAIPKGAEGIGFIVDPDPAGVDKAGGWKAWQREIARQMEEEGITITSIKGATFEGYYFADKITPRVWLHRENKKASR